MLHRGDREMSCRQGDRPGYLSSEQVWCAKITFKCNKSFQSCCPRPVGRPWLCDLWLRHCSEAEQQVCEGSWQESKNCSKAGNAGKCSHIVSHPSIHPHVSLSFLNVCAFRWRTMWSKLRSWSSALRTSPASVYWKDSKSRCVPRMCEWLGNISRHAACRSIWWWWIVCWRSLGGQRLALLLETGLS